MSSSRIPSHQLSNGLIVSGRPEQHQPKERQPSMASCAAPFTGGDIKKSGELGKMLFNIPNLDPTVTTPRPSRSGSGPQRHPGSRPNSGIQPTGLITSGPVGSTSARRSGQLDGPGSRKGSGPIGSSSARRSGSKKSGYGAVSGNVSEGLVIGFAVSKIIVWVFLVVVMMGLLVGGFLLLAVKKGVVLFAVSGFVGVSVLVVVWSFVWRKKGVEGFIMRYPDAELRGATDGQFIKVTGVVTCGSIPLQTSYQMVPRCVYVSTELYEYKGFGGKPANPKHRCLSWGSRHSERYVADFYISDFQSGLRALVKAGQGAKVAAFVKPATVLDVTKENRDFSPSFIRWLSDRNLSSDDRIMRLKEGYIKEGSTVSVMGVVRRQDNVLMIVPPAEPVSIGCQWTHFLLPTYVEGLIVKCDDSQNDDVVAV